MRLASFFICILTIWLFNCRGKKVDSIPLPNFESNATIGDVWQPIRETVSEDKFFIAYSEIGGHGFPVAELDHLILAYNGTSWRKIHMKYGIVDSKSTSGLDGVSRRNVTVTESISVAEANLFLKMIDSVGVFSLPEEAELLSKCNRKVDYTDASGILLYIMKDQKVRVLKYEMPSQRRQDCPEAIEWSIIVEISDYFKKSWFTQKYVKGE